MIDDRKLYTLHTHGARKANVNAICTSTFIMYVWPYFNAAMKALMLFFVDAKKMS